MNMVYKRGLQPPAVDPNNAQWKRGLIVSNVKLTEVTGHKVYMRQSLNIKQAMQQRATLAPRDAWMIDELKRWFV